MLLGSKGALTPTGGVLLTLWLAGGPSSGGSEDSFSGCSGPRPAPGQPGSPGETRQLPRHRHASPSLSFPGTRTCGPGAYLAVTSPLEAPVTSTSAFSSV